MNPTATLGRVLERNYGGLYRLAAAWDATQRRLGGAPGAGSDDGDDGQAVVGDDARTAADDAGPPKTGRRLRL
jgi:hypothetical protein